MFTRRYKIPTYELIKAGIVNNQIHEQTIKTWMLSVSKYPCNKHTYDAYLTYVKQAMEIYELAKNKFHKNIVMLNILLNIISKTKKPDIMSAIALYDEAFNKGIITPITVGTLLKIISKQKKPNIEYATWVYYSARNNDIIDVHMVNVLLTMIATQAKQDIDLAIDIYYHANTYNHTDIVTINILLKMIAQQPKPDTELANRLYHSSISNHDRFTALHWAQIINKVARINQVTTMQNASNTLFLRDVRYPLSRYPRDAVHHAYNKNLIDKDRTIEALDLAGLTTLGLFRMIDQGISLAQKEIHHDKSFSNPNK